MNDNEYTLTRSAFAKSIGKSVGSVKQAMRRGHYRDQYVVRNGQYFFKPKEGLRENQVNTQGNFVPTKRKINRGNHHNAKYPNEAFRKHNELKMLLKIKRNVPDEVAQEFLLEFDKAKQQQDKKIQKQISMSIPKNYGGMIRGPQPVYGRIIDVETKWTAIFPKPKNEYDKAMKEAKDNVDYSKKYY
jgi:hypothetical protein